MFARLRPIISNAGTRFKSSYTYKAPKKNFSPLVVPVLTSFAVAATFLKSDAHLATDGMHYDFVIIGNGTAAYTALEAVRDAKPKSKILLISEDQGSVRQDVYTEGTLSVILQDVYNEWRRHIGCKLHMDELTENKVQPVRSWTTRGVVQFPKAENIRSSGMSVMLENMDSIQLDPVEKTITFLDGRSITYGKCLLSPAGNPREMYVLKSTMRYLMQEKLNTLRDSQDFENLERIVKEGNKRILVVGGGFLGCSLSAALLEINKLTNKGNTIIQTFVESVSLQNYLPDYLTAHIADKLEAAGLVMLPDCLVTSVARADSNVQPQDDDDGPVGEEDPASVVTDSALQVKLMQSGVTELVDVDYVVLASTNVQPDVRVAKSAGLEIDEKNGGVLVNSSLEAYDGVFVAGNSASYFDLAMGRKRVDFYDNAVNSGLLAGQNMSGDRVRRYSHQPMIRCTLPGVGILLEGVGLIDSNLETVGVWLSKRDEITRKPLDQTSFDRGIVYYLRNNIVVGVLCYNASECLEVARDMMSEHLTAEEAAKRIMLAPDQWLRVYRRK